MLRNRAYTGYHLVRYWRYLWMRLRCRHVVTEGFVFLGKGVRLYARKGYGRLVLGRFVHLGDGTRLHAHEGTLRIGEKTVLGRDVTINCYLDVEVGPASLLADWCYVTDFDHVTTELDVPIKDQGLVKSPVRIGPGCWLGVRTTVLRGSRIGQGAVIGAHAVVRGEIPDEAIAVGVPAKVVRDRRAIYEKEAAKREYLQGLARGNEEAAAKARRQAASGE
ncbi:MAG TPA: acyltransferase [Actinopolymorphaceae bacterium]|jgi:acetyltransferase-like isoleucine patch superfamily enzyme